MRLDQIVEGAAQAIVELVAGLAAGKRHVPLGGLPAPIDLAGDGQSFRVAAPVQDAAVDLSKGLDYLYGGAGLLGDAVSRLAGSLERAGVDAVQLMVRQALGDAPGLLESALGEG